MTGTVRSRLVIGQPGLLHTEITNERETSPGPQGFTAHAFASIEAFPTAQFAITPSLDNNKLSPDLFRRGTPIEFYVQRDGEDEVKLFSGLIETVKGEIAAKEPFSIQISAVSAFVKLSEIRLSAREIAGCTGLRCLAEKLEKMIGYGVRIIVHEQVEDTLDIQLLENFPALTLLKMVFLQKELAMIIPHGDEMTIMPLWIVLNPRSIETIKLGDEDSWKMEIK